MENGKDEVCFGLFRFVNLVENYFYVFVSEGDFFVGVDLLYGFMDVV